LRAAGATRSCASARTFRNQALCYPPDSNDRVAALTRAVTQLDRIKGELRVGDDLLWQVYLDEAVCYRLLGSIEEARRVLTAPLSKSAPNAVRLQAEGEHIRLELASGKPQDALDLLTQIRRTGQTGVPELDFAEVETYVALWRAASAAGESASAKKWQAKVVATVRYLEETYGAYWGRRGELLLLRTAASSDHAGDNVDILERTGDDLYGKNRRGEAVAVYAKAAAQATASGADQRAFDLQLKAALVEQEDHDYAAASQRLGRLVDDHPQNAKTAQAHLMAIWNTAQSARTDPKMLDRYTKMLDKHVATWPLDPTTATARLWLGRFREGQRDWIAALAAYQHVPHDSTGFPQAVEGAARCWLNRLRDLRAAGRPTEHDAEVAIAFFDSLIRAPNGQWPSHWSEAQRIAVLAGARIRLAFSKKQRNLTLEFLNTAIQRNRDAPDDWLKQATTLRIVALACQPAHRAEARQLLRRASTQSVERELELVHLLGQLRDDAEGNSGPEIAQLQLIALDRLKPSLKQLDSAQRRKLALLRAESLLAAGQRNEGIESFQQLAVAYPDDAAIQIRFAELLLERTEPASLRRALDQWRRVARRLKPGSDDWYHAKLAIARAYLKLGDRKEAADRLKYLQATSNVRQSKWGRQVQELLNESR